MESNLEYQKNTDNNDKKIQTEYEKLWLPGKIFIGPFSYSYKKKLLNDNYSYICSCRKCPVLMTINITEINKILKKQLKILKLHTLTSIILPLIKQKK